MDLQATERELTRAGVTGILVDETHNSVIILTRLKLGIRIQKAFPSEINGVHINYVGEAKFEDIPPAVPHAGTLPQKPIYLHNSRIACGSSITAAPVPAAGTLGALVVDHTGQIYGLTNNHVTGDCNHTLAGMPVLCPAPMDAQPDILPPMCVGRHSQFIELRSGDPLQTALQEVDAALFTISEPKFMTSMQGNGAFDTPSKTTPPAGGMRVKKIGRTTGVTYGTIGGEAFSPFRLPYTASRFNASVYFDGIWGVLGDNDEPFSLGGDSGSLVVTEDGSAAVGVIFAGFGSTSMMMPIDTVLSAFSVTLVSGLNV